jgi:Protein phosphatase inhibitor
MEEGSNFRRNEVYEGQQQQEQQQLEPPTAAAPSPIRSRHIRWSSGVIDNENMNKKKSNGNNLGVLSPFSLKT